MEHNVLVIPFRIFSRNVLNDGPMVLLEVARMFSYCHSERFHCPEFDSALRAIRLTPAGLFY